MASAWCELSASAAVIVVSWQGMLAIAGIFPTGKCGIVWVSPCEVCDILIACELSAIGTHTKLTSKKSWQTNAKSEGRPSICETYHSLRRFAVDDYLRGEGRGNS